MGRALGGVPPVNPRNAVSPSRKSCQSCQNVGSLWPSVLPPCLRVHSEFAVALLFALSPFQPGLSAAPARSAAPGPALVRVQTIPLPGVAGRIDHLAVDVPGQRLFVAALGNNTLEVLDVKRGVRLRSVRGLREPQGVAFAPEVGRVFVGNGGGASCEILDGKTLERVGSVPDLEDADNVRCDAGKREVYVGYGSGALCVIDGRSGKRLRQIPLGGHPESFQLAKAGSRLFVNVPDAGQIAVVDRGKPAVVATWPVRGAGANFPMALDERHHRLFVGCRRPARLLVYDTETGRPVAATPIVGDTDDLFYDAARRRLYVSGGAGAITVIA
jgi:DNA-binding beta-propeller fold protein YncE